jgi:hypothetical protein
MPHPSIRMKLWPSAAMLVAAALLTASTAGATDRDYLRAKLSFRYVAQPNTITSTPAVLDNAAVGAGTESGTFWTNGSVAGLQGVVRALLREPGRGGDANLQHVVASVVGILDRPVRITLLDDTGPALTQAAMDQWDACDNGHGRAWPCASNSSTTDDQREQCARSTGGTAPARLDATWAGGMTLGQTAFNGGTAGNPIGTFVHELVHTQDRSDSRAHQFIVSGTSYHYGADGDHYTIEAVPNLAATYQEGIANAVMMTVDFPSQQSSFNWFANNGVMMVERALPTHPPGTGPGAAPCWTVVTTPSEDVWLYNQLHTAGVREVTRTPNPHPGYNYFRIRDLPPRFIVHNENIIALVFSEYARHLGLQKFLNALKTNDATIFRVSTSPIAQLYNTLCRAGLDGRALSSVMGVNEAGPKPYLIPLAYADYFTAYRSASKADYASIFENMLPREWVDLYWDGYKDNVRLAVPMDATHTPQFGNLTDIAIALGVNSSTPEH